MYNDVKTGDIPILSFLKGIDYSMTVENIYAQIRKEFEGRITAESRLIVRYSGDVLMMYDA